MNLEGKQALVVGTAVAIAAVAFPAVVSAWRNRKPRRPTTPCSQHPDWRCVGSLKKIMIYPLKSGKYLDLEEAECDLLGLRQVVRSDDKLPLRDRYFILFREDNGELLTGRTYPKILQVEVEAINLDSVRMTFPDKDDLIVKIPKEGKAFVSMWMNEKVECLDCGDEAATWMTEAVKGRKAEGEEAFVGLRLGFWPSPLVTRNLVGSYKDFAKQFKGFTNMDGGAFSDLTSYMLMTTSSVDELNRRLTDLVMTERQFRPSLYVQTDEKPFSEIKWEWVKIGETIFRFVKGCKRCVFTTIDPETGKKYPRNEPLNTLNSIEEAKTTEPIAERPIMGIHIGLHGGGTLHTGDPVYVI